MKKIIAFGLLVCLRGYFVYGQQESLFTHYMSNTSQVNPAYAGSRGALSATLLSRFQWVGFEGAPLTQTLNINTPLLEEQLGVGLSILNDRIGPTNTTLLDADFAYRMKLNRDLRLNFGLKGGVGLFNVDINSLHAATGGDASLGTNVSEVQANFGFGLLLQHKHYYFGLSSPKLLEPEVYGGILSSKRHYYSIAGVVIKMNKEWSFKPTALIKYVQGVKVQGDLTAGFEWNSCINFGIGYRTNSGFSAIFGVNINSQFLVSYSYDYSSYFRTGITNGGSHELLLRYELNYKYTRTKYLRSPRHFN